MTFTMPREQRYVKVTPELFRLRLEHLYGRSLSVLQMHDSERWGPGRQRAEVGYVPGLVMRRGRVFGFGDVVFASICNGSGERYPALGWSTKKRCAIPGGHWPNKGDFYVQCYRGNYGAGRWHDSLPEWQVASGPRKNHSNLARVRLIELPDELRAQSLADPAVRAYALESLQAVYAASR